MNTVLHLNQLDQLQKVLESAPTALLAVTIKGNIVFSNALAEKYFRYDKNELLSKSIESLIPERFRLNHFSFLQSYFMQPESRPMGAERELFALRSDGTEFPVEIGLNPISTGHEELVVATIIDITDRKKSEERYKKAIQQSPVGLLIAAEDGSVILSNEALDVMFGFDANELAGRKVEELLPDDIRAIHELHRKHYLEAPDARQMGIGRDLYGVRKDGTEFPVEVGLNPLHTSEDTEIIVTVVDISSRRKLEREIKEFEGKVQQTQKLESLGVLAGGVAHDFNNILTGIVGNTELAMMELMPASTQAGFLRKVLESSKHAADLCNQMLAYSGSANFVNEKFDINSLLKSSVELINVSISKNSVIKFALTDNLPPMNGDPSQVRQLIMNLVINASEAIGYNDGSITISTSMMKYDPVTMAGDALLDEDIVRGNYVCLSVTDNGAGMDEKTRQKIFEPFYSTKFTGRGLGLAAVHGIVNHYRGAIRVESEKDVGTTFRILLPFGEDAAAEDSASIQNDANQNKTILIIDDEKTIHQVLGDTLKKVGYQVMHAYDGREGLNMFLQNKGSINLIILDLTMPYLSGDEVFRRIRKIDKTVDVLITSGFAEEAVIGKFQGEMISGFLPKPASPMKLLAMLNDILNNHEAS